MNPEELSRLAKAAATGAGFDVCGVAALDSHLSELEYFPQWITAGYAGEMEYLKARNEAGELKRASARATAPWACSVVVCALNYAWAAPCSTTTASDKNRGWIARYAWSREDYHAVLLRKLRQVEAELRAAAGPELITRAYVDTGPHLERVYARYAGVGWTGKNTCTIHERLGSWLFLGIILLSLPLSPDAPAPDRCGSCRRCLDACPTQALLAPYKMDATRCISYLTIEKRGDIPQEFRSAIGNNVFGCDICQEVCPWNGAGGVNRPPFTATPELEPRPELVNPALEWLAALDREDFTRVFRGSPVKRARHSGLLRNVAVAMGNSGNAGFAPQLERLAKEEDATVARHARWAIDRLKASAAQSGEKS